MIQESQFASDLMTLERVHLLRLSLWAGLSIVAGTAIIAFLRAMRRQSAILLHFAIQSAAWGAVDLAVVLWARSGLALRDLAGAIALDRFLWFNLGLDVGYVLVGATLALVGWRLGRRGGLIGAGIGIVVQGLALALLDLQLSAGILR